MLTPIIVKPINSKNIIFWGDDENKEHILEKAKNCQGTLIAFEKDRNGKFILTDLMENGGVLVLIRMYM